MTKRQQDRIQKNAEKCTTYDDMIFEDETFCAFKYKFFNAVMGRFERGYTQKDVSDFFGISLRSVVELEKGNSTNIILVNNYIKTFEMDFAIRNRNRPSKKYQWI